MAATKLKSFAFSSRASRLRGESPAQDSPRSREEREDFAKRNPFLPAKDFRLSIAERQSRNQEKGPTTSFVAGLEFSLQAALRPSRLKPELRTSPQRR